MWLTGLVSPLLGGFSKYGVIIAIVGMGALGLYGKGRMDGKHHAEALAQVKIDNITAALAVEKANEQKLQAALDDQSARNLALADESARRKQDVLRARQDADKRLQQALKDSAWLQKIADSAKGKTPDAQCQTASVTIDKWHEKEFAGRQP